MYKVKIVYPDGEEFVFYSNAASESRGNGVYWWESDRGVEITINSRNVKRIEEQEQ